MRKQQIKLQGSTVICTYNNEIYYQKEIKVEDFSIKKQNFKQFCKIKQLIEKSIAILEEKYGTEKYRVKRAILYSNNKEDRVFVFKDFISIHLQGKDFLRIQDCLRENMEYDDWTKFDKKTYKILKMFFKNFVPSKY